MELDKRLSSLQEISKAQLSKILNSVPHIKSIVLEPRIIRPLERVCGVKWLKGNGIDKIYKLEQTCPNFQGNHPVFYMAFSNFQTFKLIVEQIRSHPHDQYHLIVVPRIYPQFEQELEELGLLYKTVRLHSFQWLPFYLDTGILSLEIPMVYKTLYCENNYNHLPVLGKVLWQLLFTIGKPNLILALGNYSNLILKQADVFREEKGESDVLNSDFGALIILDRNIDYPSALLTSGVYSALLKEVYGVYCATCEHQSEEMENPRLNPVVSKNAISFTMDSRHDSIYADIKNRYFTEVTSVLSGLTKKLRDDSVRNKNMGLEEMKKYVQHQLQSTKLKKKLITTHLSAAETIINTLGSRYERQHDIEQNILKNVSKTTNVTYLNEMLCGEDDKLVTLRLFSLLCVTQKLTESEIKSFWRKYLHQHGFEADFALHHLANAAILSGTEQNSSKMKFIPKFGDKEFYTNAAKFKQIPLNPEKINLKFPTCASYVFGGNYIPFIAQLIGMLLNVMPIEEIKSKLSGLAPLTIRNDKGYPLQPRSVLVYMIGGVSYAEIAACNLLENVIGAKIVLFSDRIISGNDLMTDVLS